MDASAIERYNQNTRLAIEPQPINLISNQPSRSEQYNIEVLDSSSVPKRFDSGWTGSIPNQHNERKKR